MLTLFSRYTRTKIGLGVLCADAVYAYWYERDRDKRIDAVLENVDCDRRTDALLEQNRPAPVDPNVIDRPDAERMVKNVIESPPSKYDIIVGNYGTGKSTLVYRLARRLPGIVYVTVPPAMAGATSYDVQFRFARALEAALDWKAPGILWPRFLLGRVGRALEGKHAPLCFVCMLMYSVKACRLMADISRGWRISCGPLLATRRSIRPAQ